MHHYCIEISHKKDFKATSFFTYSINLSEEQVKEIIKKVCHNVVVDRIYELKEMPENIKCPMCQGLHVLNLNYSSRRKERIKEKLDKFITRIFKERKQTYGNG